MLNDIALTPFSSPPEHIYYSLETEGDTETSDRFEYTNPYLKSAAVFFAYGSQLGNFPNCFFNFFVTYRIFTDIIIELNDDPEISPEAKAGCYYLAAHFAFFTLINDIGLNNWAENFHEAYVTLDRFFPIQINLDNPIKKISYGLLFTIFYSAFAIQSANGAAGMLEIFSLSVLVKTLGVIFGLGTIVLGVTYSHFYYRDNIKETLIFLYDSLTNPRETAKNILKNFLRSLQIIKSFSFISVYYSTMGGFYLRSTVVLSALAFQFQINAEDLFTGMLVSSGFIFVTNFFTRFLRTKDQYLNAKFSTVTAEDLTHTILPAAFYADITLEFLIAGAMAILSDHSTTGLLISAGFLVIGVPATYQSHQRHAVLQQREEKARALQQQQYMHTQTSDFKRQQSAKKCCSAEKLSTGLAAVVNFNARVHKSGILLFAAFYKIQTMLQDEMQINLNLSLSSTACLVVIFGGYIGLNKSANDKKRLRTHFHYLAAKARMRHFSPSFWLITPKAAFPRPQREILDDILAANKPRRLNYSLQ